MNQLLDQDFIDTTFSDELITEELSHVNLEYFSFSVEELY